MPAQDRPKVVVAGAGGSIGSAVSHDLAKDYDITALVGSQDRLQESEFGLSYSWRACEPFSRQDVQKHSSPDRRMYFITGGLLAGGHDELTPRFEFRDVLDGRYTIAAIHDFRPQLSWGLYSLTQAVIHLIAMRSFQKYMAKKRE